MDMDGEMRISPWAECCLNVMLGPEDDRERVIEIAAIYARHRQCKAISVDDVGKALARARWEASYGKDFSLAESKLKKESGG